MAETRSNFSFGNSNYGKPKFPIIDAAPDTNKTLGAMRFSDYGVIVAAGGSSWIFGYVTGRPLRMPAAATACTIGISAGVLLACQNSFGRLMGYHENAREVAKYGVPDSTAA